MDALDGADLTIGIGSAGVGLSADSRVGGVLPLVSWGCSIAAQPLITMRQAQKIKEWFIILIRFPVVVIESKSAIRIFRKMLKREPALK